MVLRLPGAFEQALHQLSGARGVVTGKFIEGDADREYFSVIPIKGTREQVIEQSKFIGADAWGVVPTRDGWGVRVRTALFEALAKRLRPDDHQKITGKVFEISGMPMWVCEEALAEFLGPTTTLLEVRGTKKRGWGEQERRSFFVRVTPDIIWTRKQGDGFLATCTVAEKRKPPTTPSPTYRLPSANNHRGSVMNDVQSQQEALGGLVVPMTVDVVGGNNNM